jgi:hypothetical protein
MNYILPKKLGYGSFITTIPNNAVEIYHTTLHHGTQDYNKDYDFIYRIDDKWTAIQFQGLGLYAEYDFPEKPDLTNYKKITKYFIQL